MFSFFKKLRVLFFWKRNNDVYGGVDLTKKAYENEGEMNEHNLSLPLFRKMSVLWKEILTGLREGDTHEVEVCMHHCDTIVTLLKSELLPYHKLIVNILMIKASLVSRVPPDELVESVFGVPLASKAEIEIMDEASAVAMGTATNSFSYICANLEKFGYKSGEEYLESLEKRAKIRLMLTSNPKLRYRDILFGVKLDDLMTTD